MLLTVRVGSRGEAVSAATGGTLMDADGGSDTVLLSGPDLIHTTARPGSTVPAVVMADVLPRHSGDQR